MTEKTKKPKQQKKLWLLESRDEELDPNDNPWKNRYDMNYAVVVCALTEESARQHATKAGGDEVGRGRLDAWLNPRYSTCCMLTPNRKAGVVIVNSIDG